jgi:hypothetical protein
MLLVEGVVKGDHPCFTSWFDMDGEKCMFSEYQVDNWEQPHLKACHWYLETPIEKTPQHEQLNRRCIDPSFSGMDLLPPQPAKAPTTSQSKSRKEPAKGKTELQLAQHARANGSARVGKRGLPPVASEASKRTRVEGNEVTKVDPQEITQSHFQNISSKAISQAPMSSIGNEWSRRNSLINRDLGGRDFDELVLYASLEAFLDNPNLGNRFAKFTAKVKGLCLALLKNNTNHAFLAQNCR